MKVIVGLGNPGEKYKETRHNVGFLVVDELKNQISNHKSQISSFQFQKKFKTEILLLRQAQDQNDKDILLVKPQTFMNASGLAVKKIIDFYKKSFDHLITKSLNHLTVIHDDLDIPLGEYKIQFGRSAAGHHGVQSIIDALGTNKFWRVRIGIDNRILGYQDTRILGEQFVLQNFNREEKKIIDKVIKQIVERLSSDCS